MYILILLQNGTKGTMMLIMMMMIVYAHIRVGGRELGDMTAAVIGL